LRHRRSRRANLAGESFQSGRHVLSRFSQNRSVETFRNQLAGKIGITEKRDGSLRTGEHNRIECLQHLDCLLGKVGQAIEYRHSRTALESRGKRFADQMTARLCGDACSRFQSACAKASTAEKERDSFALA